MVKKYLSYNNNASFYPTHFREQSKVINNCQDELSNSSYNSQTLHIIRSIVDELYHINNQETLSRSEQKEKRVRFTLKKEIDTIKSIISNESESIEAPIKNTLEKDKSSIKYQPVLSESATVVCSLIQGRSKVDCSVSTNDLPSLQCECATQTMDMTVIPDYSHSLMSLSRASDDQTSSDFHRQRSNITLSTTWISDKPTITRHTSMLSITNHTLYSCENNNIVPLLSIAHQLMIPSKATHYDVCQEQTLENYNTLFKSDRKLSDENRIETAVELCTCSKRKLSDNHFPIVKVTLSNQDRLLEELYLSKRSLQSMHNDGLFYIHDLLLVYLKNISQFHQILLEHYHLSKNQADLFVKIMNKWWEKYQTEFINIKNEILSTSNIIK